MTAVSWYGCDFPSGRIIAELPGVTTDGPLSQRIGSYSSTSLSLDLSARTPGWIAATQSGRALLVACIADDPVWAGLVLPRDRGSSRVATLTATTMESYLDRRYTGSLTLSGDLADIAAGLLSAIVSDTPCMAVSAAPTGVTSSRKYLDSDDQTVFSALTELMGLDAGPEFTVAPAWLSDRTGFTFNIAISPRLGISTANPAAIFDYPGPVVEYSQQESYEGSKGATVVVATGAGEGPSRATSGALTSSLVSIGWPVYEYRFSPGPDITSLSALQSHASSALAAMETGASAWTMVAHLADAPPMGRDWSMGDYVSLVVQPGTSPGHPEGATVSGRVWAWEMDPVAETISPIFLES